MVDARDEDAFEDLEYADSPSATRGETSSELTKVMAERDEYLKNLQRSQADYQNLRRRLQSDIDAAVQRAKMPLYQDLLLVLDYLDMALATSATSPETKNVLAGVEMTKGGLVRALEKENVKPLPDGGTFDPAIHQAVESVEKSDLPNGEIVATLRRGYTVGGNVLRPAQVKVNVTSEARSEG
jgi:molecular chaperone GrpE